MKNKKITAIIVATTISFAGISYAVADKHQEKKQRHGCNNQMGKMKHAKQQRMMLSKLNLTESQNQTVQEIMSVTQEGNKETNLAHKVSMQALMNDEIFNEEKATELINNQEEQKAKKHLAMIKVKHQIFQILTEEQKTQYNELKTQRQHR
jgi:periplasmic protein CpxP/Spy